MIRSIIALVLILLAVIGVCFFVDPLPLLEMQCHMLKISGIIVLAVGMACFILAELTGNYSQIDKIWSIIPVVYMWYFAYASEWDARLLLMAICITVWGVRLTYNFSRRGAYKLKFWTGEEDYRWEILRQNSTFKGHPIRWKLFSFFFIAFYQSMLLWSITLPAVIAYAGHGKPLGWADYLLGIIIIALVAIEATADQQQWNYQNEKHRRKNAGEKVDGEYAVGFIRTGLWSHSRHPNYACEQTIWVVLYLFGVITTGAYINWSEIGCILLLILFQGSADFSEGVSLSKYPAYADYIKRVPKFLFRFW